MKDKLAIGVAILWLALPAGELAAFTTDYTYDSAGRLVRADYSTGGRIDYAYDANGNLLQRTVTGGGVVTYTLIYRAGAGGRMDGVATQVVAAGASGSPVVAVVEDPDAVFGRWSDGRPASVRIETNVQAHLTVYARFRSTNGADLDWYARHGIAPAPGETWANVDARSVPGKGTTYLHQNIADLDPNDADSVFRVIGMDPGPPIVVHFEPGSTGRVYTFQFVRDAVDGLWTNVPGTVPRFGRGASDSMIDPNPDGHSLYRIHVELP